MHASEDYYFRVMMTTRQRVELKERTRGLRSTSKRSGCATWRLADGNDAAERCIYRATARSLAPLHFFTQYVGWRLQLQSRQQLQVWFHHPTGCPIGWLHLRRCGCGYTCSCTCSRACGARARARRAGPVWLAGAHHEWIRLRHARCRKHDTGGSGKRLRWLRCCRDTERWLCLRREAWWRRRRWPCLWLACAWRRQADARLGCRAFRWRWDWPRPWSNCTNLTAPGCRA